MTVASIGQKIIAFLYFAIIARVLGADLTGKYATALAFSTIFVVFVDLGLTNVLIREAAKYKRNIQQYLSSVLWVKMFLGGAAYIAMIIMAHILEYPQDIKQLIYLSGITMLADSIHLSLYGVLRSFGQLKYEAVGIVTSQAITLILGGIALYAQLPLSYLILAFTIPSIINMVYAMAILRYKYSIFVIPIYNKAMITSLLLIAIPFAIAAIFARVYSYIDTILLSKLASTTAVGLYSIPYKITFAFQFIPLALVAALYPKLSEYYHNDKKKLSIIFEQSIKYLLIIVLPLSIGIISLASDIVITFFTPAYQNSVIPLQILMAGLIFSFISFPIGAMLNACNKQTIQTIIIGIVMIVNIVLNIILIPRMSIVGAAIAAGIGNVLLTVAGYVIIPRITKIAHKAILSHVIKLGTAAGIMGVVVIYINMYVHFSIAIAVGICTYSISIFVLKAVTTQEIKGALHLIKGS